MIHKDTAPTGLIVDFSALVLWANSGGAVYMNGLPLAIGPTGSAGSGISTGKAIAMAIIFGG